MTQPGRTPLYDEHLAAVFLDHIRVNRLEEKWTNFTDEEKLEELQGFMSGRYSEGYTKGVHDKDGLKIFDKLIDIDSKAGLLRYLPGERAVALLDHEEHDAEEGHAKE